MRDSVFLGGACFTCSGLADGLADAIKFACMVAVEEPLVLVTGTPLRNVVCLFAMHRSGARIQGCLGTFALLHCTQHAVCTAPFGVVLKHETACGVS